MLENTKLDDLVSVKSFCARYPDVGTEAGVRWQIFCAEENGLAEAGAIIRCGRKILIDVPRYRNWLVNHRVGSNSQVA